MYKLADGTYDYLPKECLNLFKLSDRLLESFLVRGFMRVDTPIIERLELFSKEECGVDITRMFKLTDSDGDVLVLRPDMTMPIARVATTKVDNADRAKFCYVSKAFDFKASGKNMREFTQAGVEVFAPSNAYVDADIIVLAIKSLINAGLKDFQIDIGHVGYFKGLLGALNLSDTDSAELVRLVNNKDAFGIELFAKENAIDRAALDGLLKLPMLFGGIEVLDRAENLTDIPAARYAIYNLREIYKYIKEIGYESYVTFDLSLVNGVRYYSGVVFSGITRHFGAPILGGGRYDELCNAFGKRLPATGFAIGVNNLLEAIRRESGRYNEEPRIGVALGGATSQAEKISKIIEKYAEKGIIAENTYIQEETELAEYASNHGAKALFISADGEERWL